MPDNQVFTNPRNSHCSMSQPVQNLSKFSFRIESFSALSLDRRLLLSARMSPADSYLRISVKHQIVSTQRVATASLALEV